MSAYTWINKVLNMAAFRMFLMQHIALVHCTNYWSVIETQTYSERCPKFKMERFAKLIVKFFRAGQVSWNLETSRNNLPKIQEEKALQTFWSFFSWYSWNHILNGKFNRKMDTIRAFFPKIRVLFSTFKKGQANMSLNMPENLWINCSVYASVLILPRHLRYLTEVSICLNHYIY